LFFSIGAVIGCSFRYDKTGIDNRDGRWSSAGNQIIFRNRIGGRIIEHATTARAYDPNERGTELNLQVLDDVIE
jgi:hypothetical protein